MYVSAAAELCIDTAAREGSEHAMLQCASVPAYHIANQNLQFHCIIIKIPRNNAHLFDIVN